MAIHLMSFADCRSRRASLAMTGRGMASFSPSLYCVCVVRPREQPFGRQAEATPPRPAETTAHFQSFSFSRSGESKHDYTNEPDVS